MFDSNTTLLGSILTRADSSVGDRGEGGVSGSTFSGALTLTVFGNNVSESLVMLFLCVTAEGTQAPPPNGALSCLVVGS